MNKSYDGGTERIDSVRFEVSANKTHVEIYINDNPWGYMTYLTDKNNQIVGLNVGTWEEQLHCTRGPVIDYMSFFIRDDIVERLFPKVDWEEECK